MTNIDKKISIGILTYKRTDLLVSTIKELLFVESKVDLVIINNNETLDIYKDLDFLNEFENIKLTYIWDKVNYGVSVGRNKIIQLVETEYVIMLDDDVCIPNINYIIDSCIRKFEEDLMIGAIAFHIKDIKTGIANKYEIPHKNKLIDMSKDFDTYLFIGAAHALRMSILSETGYYPNDFGLYGMEEIDLAYRIVAKNYRIQYLSNNIIYHKRSPNGRHCNNYIYYLSFLNRCKISIRYLKWRYVCSVIIVRGIYLVFKTKQVFWIFKAVPELYREIKKRIVSKNKLFNKTFYQNIKRLNGFLWW